MTNQIRFTDEELKSVLDLRERIRANVESIGRLNIKRYFVQMDLDQIVEDLNHSYSTTEELSLEETRIMQQITEKYGEGDLDFITGVYTPKV